MNRIYRLVYNHALGLMQVASEIGASAGRGRSSLATSPRSVRLAPLAAALLLATSLQAAAQSQSLPQNGQIIAGSASINSSGNALTVNQNSQSALIQWQSFNIGAGNQVNFNLPSSQAVSINQVIGGSASAIAGQMVSNGQVFLLNPSGIAFTSSASVNVGGLLATTLNVGMPSLPVDGGPLPPMFQLAGGGTGATISNNGGTLIASNGGISLVGGAVSNSGVISATNGNIDLVAAGGVLVAPEPSSTGYLRLSFATTAASTATAIGVLNTGTLAARNIGMNALMGPGLSSVGINTGGTITANVIDADDGSLTIRSSSAIQVSGGEINARSVDLAATDAVGLAGDINADDIAIQARSVMQTAGAVQGALQLGVQGSVNLAQADNRITTVGGTVVAGLTLATNTDLSNGAALSVGGTSTLSAGQAGARRDITLTNTGNRFSGEVSLNAANAELHAGNLILSNSRLDRDLTLALSGGLGQSAGSMLDVGGATRITAGTWIQLNNTGDQGSAVNRFGGAVSLSGGESNIRGTGTLAFADLNVGSVEAIADTVKLPVEGHSIGLQYYQGAIELAGDTVLESQSGQIYFRGSVDGGHALTITRAANVMFGGNVGSNRALASLDTRNGGPLYLSGNITADGAIMLGNLSLSSAVPRLFSVRSNSGSLQVGRIDGSNTGQTSLALTAQGTLDLLGDAGTLAGAGLNNLQLSGATVNTKAIRTSGTLDITSTTGFTQVGTLDIGGNASFTAGNSGDIELTNDANRFGGVVSLQGRNAFVTTAGALKLGDVTTGQLQANATGNLELNGHITADDAALSTGALFDNRTGADAIRINGSGSWRIYLDSPDQAHVFNNLDSGNTALWNTPAFTGIPTPGNRYVFAWQPTLTLGGAMLHKTYGDSLDLSTAFTASGVMGGVTGAYRGDTLADLFTGTLQLTSAGAAATANASATPYLIDVVQGTLDTSVSGYALALNPGQLFVDRRGLSISAQNSNKIYGQAGGLSGFNGKGLVNGDTISSVDLASNGTAATANVGNYTITASNADGTGLSNYDITYVDGRLSIGKAGLTITAGNGSKTYGQNGSLGGYAVDGLLNNDAVSSVALDSKGTAATANVGNYTITASNADGTGLSNYDISYVDGTLSIGKAGLTITAGNGSKTYGRNGGLGGYAVDGLLNNDAVSSVALGSKGSAATANVGDYTITASNADGIGLSNYDITYVDGTLSIGKAGLTITAGNGSKTYGQTGGLGGYAADGLRNNDAVSSVVFDSKGSAATANVGNYTITASNADGTGLSNYDITYVDGTLSIGKAGLTITANSGSRSIGQASSLYGYTADGLLNGDSIDEVALSSNGVDVNAQPGAYAILASDAEGARLGNYDITYRQGTLNVVGVSAGPDAQIAREVAANMNKPVIGTLTASSDAPLFELNEAAIQPASDSCASLGESRCLTRQPE